MFLPKTRHMFSSISTRRIANRISLDIRSIHGANNQVVEMRTLLLSVVAFIIATARPSISFAEEKEEVVAAQCIAKTGPTAIPDVSCVVEGLTGNEIETCVTTPLR
jgi:hypothetical protein